MKRITWAVLLLMLGCVPSARAQMGMDVFKRPTFTNTFHPVVGQGAEYETTSMAGGDTKTVTMGMGIVGKESAEGKDGYWMEFVLDQGAGRTLVGKMLLTIEDFQVHRMIMQMPGQGAIEMPINMMGAQKTKVENNMADWQSVGTETITVPAGTFGCDHWKNQKTSGEVWTSEKVSPYGLVKEMSKDHSMVLTKVLSDFPERITGPVQKFDPQMMMQQMQQRQHP